VKVGTFTSTSLDTKDLGRVGVGTHTTSSGWSVQRPKQLRASALT
jgi:hypothetical protein